MKTEQVPVIIIGAGLAGIATAIRLSRHFHRVVVLERSSDYGGKLRAWESQGYRFDQGPSLFTLPEEVDALFELCEENPRDHFNFKRHHSSCTYFFSDGTSIRFSDDRPELIRSIIATFSAEEANLLLQYLECAKDTYQNLGEFFTDQRQPGWGDILRPELLKRYPALLSSRVRKSLHDFNEDAFKDSRVVQIFDRFGTYNGSDPYKMSGLFSMIPHLEINRGTFFPEGGMRSIAESLYQLALRQGVEFHFDCDLTHVKQVENGYLVQTNQYSRTSAKLICALDHLTFYRDILKDGALFRQYQKQERSTSALVFYWGVEVMVPELDLHNILFSEDYEREFEDLFNRKIIPVAPTIYIHISSLVNTSDAPAGCQNWFVMLNMPAGYEPTSGEIAQLRLHVFERVRKKFGLLLKDKIKLERIWTGKGIETDTGSYQGALYGAASNGKLAALKRHGNVVKKYPGLYFCGGTVHPGGGIPLVLKSAKIVSELIHG